MNALVGRTTSRRAMRRYDALPPDLRLRSRYKNDPWALADELLSTGIPLEKIVEVGLPITPKMRRSWENRVKSSGFSEMPEGGQSAWENPFGSSGTSKKPRGGQR